MVFLKACGLAGCEMVEEPLTLLAGLYVDLCLLTPERS